MTQYPKSQRERCDLATTWLKELERPTSRLTERELRFLDEIQWQIESQQFVTEKQMAWLERVYAEKGQ